MDSKRFSNILGEDYELLKLVIPHHDEFQDKIGEIIKSYCDTLKNEVISIVEGGTGTGLTTVRILETDRRIKVLGIDSEEKVLNQARKTLSSFTKRIEFENRDLIEALRDISDYSTDVFVSAWVIHNLDNNYRQKLFSEISRILKPGGLFISGDNYARDKDKEHQKDLEKRIEAFENFAKMGRPDLKDEWTKHCFEDEKIKITESE